MTDADVAANMYCVGPGYEAQADGKDNCPSRDDDQVWPHTPNRVEKDENRNGRQAMHLKLYRKNGSELSAELSA